MAALTDISEGLKNALLNIDGVRAFDYVPDQLPVPCGVVTPESVEYDTTMRRGADTYLMNVSMIVARATDRWAQSALAGYVAGSGDSSVKAAIEADPTLGGVAQTLRVTRAGSISRYQQGDVTYLVVEFTVEVIA